MSGIQKDTRDIWAHPKHFFRMVFTVYWSNAMPSTEVFYVTKYPICLNLEGVDTLQNEMVGRLQSNGYTNVIRAIYVGFSDLEMSDEDVQSAGWRAFVGPTPPAPPVVNSAPRWIGGA